MEIEIRFDGDRLVADVTGALPEQPTPERPGWPEPVTKPDDTISAWWTDAHDVRIRELMVDRRWWWYWSATDELVAITDPDDLAAWRDTSRADTLRVNVRIASQSVPERPRASRRPAAGSAWAARVKYAKREYRATLGRMLVDIHPQQGGTIERDGVRIAFQVFGDGPQSLLLLPTWPIVHSDFWRAQVPHLMTQYRLVTFDGRGNGASDRPEDVASYTGDVMVADALAVLDAVDVNRAAVLSVSLGAFWAALLAVNHPERVAALAFIAPYLPLGPQTAERAAAETSFDTPQPQYVGWQKWNRHYWHEDWAGFLEFFFSQCFTEPDSRPYVDHFIGMGLQTKPAVIALTEDAGDLDEAIAYDLARRIRCPSLVIHGSEDAIAPVSWGIELATIVGAELHVVPGGGHEPELREADETNGLLDDFLARVWPSTSGIRPVDIHEH